MPHYYASILIWKYKNMHVFDLPKKIVIFVYVPKC